MYSNQKIMSHLPHRRYSSDFRKEILSEYHLSQESIKDFSKSKGIPFTTLANWIQKSEKKDLHSKSHKQNFIPIEIEKKASSISQDLLIEFPNGVKISLPTTSDISLISSLIKSY